MAVWPLCEVKSSTGKCFVASEAGGGKSCRLREPYVINHRKMPVTGFIEDLTVYFIRYRFKSCAGLRDHHLREAIRFDKDKHRQIEKDLPIDFEVPVTRIDGNFE